MGAGGGSMLAGSGFIPLLIDGAGMTKPGLGGWLHRAAGAGHWTIWLGSPYHGLLPSGV